MRNFWIDASIDGRATNLTGGPVAKDGGFQLTVYQRSNGAITTALSVEGVAGQNGELKLYIKPTEGPVTIVASDR